MFYLLAAFWKKNIFTSDVLVSAQTVDVRQSHSPEQSRLKIKLLLKLYSSGWYLVECFQTNKVHISAPVKMYQAQCDVLLRVHPSSSTSVKVHLSLWPFIFLTLNKCGERMPPDVTSCVREVEGVFRLWVCDVMKRGQLSSSSCACHLYFLVSHRDEEQLLALS